MRSSAIGAATLGSISSAALMAYAGRNSPQRLLIVLFIIWVVFPFLVMFAFARIGTRWSDFTRQALYRFITGASIVSPLIFAFAAFGPMRDRPAPIFVIVPPLTVISLVVTMIAARRISRTR